MHHTTYIDTNCETKWGKKWDTQWETKLSRKWEKNWLIKLEKKWETKWEKHGTNKLNLVLREKGDMCAIITFSLDRPLSQSCRIANVGYAGTLKTYNCHLL